ncbi:MAG: hypothetical protein IJU98_03055 [Synergistaceae bacterium]|nr:hypothetical protein [Synergistaceae bacterium]
MAQVTSADNAEYVRRDVFDAKMEAFMAEIRLGNAEIRKEIGQLENKMEVLSERVDQNFAYLNMRIDGIQTTVYWGFAIVAIAIAFIPILHDWRKLFHRPSLTAADVERMIDAAIVRTLKQFAPLQGR